jgi:tight adherence protein B
VTLISIFLIVLIVAFAVLALITEPSKTDKQIHARLAALDRDTTDAPAGTETGIVKQVTFSTIPAFDRFLRSNRTALHLQLMIEQCDLQWTVGRVIFSTLLLVGVGAALGNWWIMLGPAGWLPGLALGSVPYLYLLQRRARRLRRLAEQLPEAIDLMSRGLRAGQALPATIETISLECDDPLRSVFRRAADEQNFGLPFREAMLNISRRIPVADFQFLVTAILVQKETGGNLAQILDKASHVIRERVRVAGQLRIRTAQGRLTGWILVGLPFALFLGMNFLHPGYGRVLFEEPLGRKMITYASVMLTIGIIMVRRIVHIRF